MHPKLKVLPRGESMVPHYESLGGTTRRFIGFTHDPTAGRSVKADDGSTFMSGGWKRSAEPVEVPTIPTTDASYHAAWGEYRRDVREGALWPADKATADACGVKFDATFGGRKPAEPQPVASAASEK